MQKEGWPTTLYSDDVAPKSGTNYPKPYSDRVAGRSKRRLGDAFGLSNFGVNLTRLEPGAISALRHAHTKQDEFVYVLEGTPTLVNDRGNHLLEPGMCAGFKAGHSDAHHLVNRSNLPVVYLEIGDRSQTDQVLYPDDDLEAHFHGGSWRFTYKNGEPY
ncbi:cupin domain-containing protein [Pseudoxanthomonas japonensis]|uniref:Cupin n=1 Tax=Pseudoxanthomonas japonensis TaxID=69284 RepID=A0ABQ6ZCD4_9GAMM|nr:cupin domain-containing protein [Pseudoxanthomonas japonensis]KAF1720622.1 cupin [Pseudoxanthomonas japonensis]